MLEVNELQISLSEGYHYHLKTPIFDETYDRSDESDALLRIISLFAQESGLTETHKDGLDPTVVSSAAKSLTDGIFEQIEAWEGSNF